MESSVESEVVTNLNIESSVGAKTVPEGTDGAVDNVPGESLQSVNDVNTTSTDDNGASQFADGPMIPMPRERPERLVVFLLINQPGGVLLIPRIMYAKTPQNSFIYAITFHISEICL